METYIIINKEDGLLSLTEDDLFDVGGNEGTSDLNFIAGANIVISRNGSNVTISSTASGEGADGNNYPTALDFNTSNGILTISRNGLPDITEAMDGRYLTSVPAQSWASITGKPTIPTNNNQLTNGAGYITGVSWSQITSKPTTFPPSSHTHNYENPLTFIGTGATTVTRSGNTITIDSTDNAGTGGDGNNYPTSMSFSTSSGLLTINRNGLSAITQNLDGRYLTSVPAQSWTSITGKPSTFAPSAHNHDDLYVRKTGGTYTGDVYAPKFFQTSLRELKKNIIPFVKDGLSLIDTLDIVEYDYKTGEGNNIGVIADDTAVEFLSKEKDAVNLYNTIFIQAKAIQELKGKVESQEERLLKLEKLVEKRSK